MNYKRGRPKGIRLTHCACKMHKLIGNSLKGARKKDRLAHEVFL